MIGRNWAIKSNGSMICGFFIIHFCCCIIFKWEHKLSKIFLIHSQLSSIFTMLPCVFLHNPSNDYTGNEFITYETRKFRFDLAHLFFRGLNFLEHSSYTFFRMRNCTFYSHFLISHRAFLFSSLCTF
jgi:hypothetical protein